MYELLMIPGVVDVPFVSLLLLAIALVSKARLLLLDCLKFGGAARRVVRIFSKQERANGAKC